MNNTNVQFGTQIASALRVSAENGASNEAPKTLADLLAFLGQNPHGTFPMLRTTAALVVFYLGRPMEDISITSMEEARKGFRKFLEGRRYAEPSIRSYVNYLRLLLNQAGILGWNREQPTPPLWQRILDQAADKKCEQIAVYLSRIKERPEDVTSEDIEGWFNHVINEDRTFRSAMLEKGRFWRVLRASGYTGQLPISVSRVASFGVPIDDFPSELKREVEELLRWKQADFALDRPKDAKLRAVSADGLKDAITQLFGFATRICGVTGITSLPALVQRQIIWRYVEWKINDRKLKPQSVSSPLERLSAAMRQHPAYRSLDHSWLKTLLDSLPVEAESELKRRKAEKYVEYSLLEAISQELHAQRDEVQRKGERRLALLVRNELLMKWLPVLPWRQRNIRECRIAGQSPNLFRRRISPFSDIDKPVWVLQEESANKAAEFWQFHFTEDETKTGIEVNAIIPRALVALLEEYLQVHRTHLLCGPDPGTLFLNERGRPMTDAQVTVTVGQMTHVYAGKRVTPHLFRDVVAFTWLKEHPKDYLTLSKILWHSNINTTIRLYGSRFNESCGVSAMDSWIEQREAKRK